MEVEVDIDLCILKGSLVELVFELMGGVRMNILLVNNFCECYIVGDMILGMLNNGMMEKVVVMMFVVEKMLFKLDFIFILLNIIMVD